jgi:hypothetical protein
MSLEEEKAAPKKNKQATVQNEPAGSLEEVWQSFTAGKNEMDGKVFAKFAKDCKLIDKKLTATDVDLVFAKIKTKAERKINYS